MTNLAWYEDMRAEQPKRARACARARAARTWKRRSRIVKQASASFFPCTVSRTMSAPASAHALICATVPSTSRVFVVVIVCSTSGWSLPMRTLPACAHNRMFHLIAALLYV